MCCQKDFISILAPKRLELPLDHAEPIICIQGVAGSGKSGWLGPQKSCQLVIEGLLSWLPVHQSIGQCLQYESLVMDYLCQVREGWWWQLCIVIFSSALTHFLVFLRMVLPIRAHSCISGCRVPDTGGPRDASRNHLQIGWGFCEIGIK